MQKNEIRVLIVEDDVPFGNVIKIAIERSGYAAEVYTRPEDALAASKRRVYPALLIDCLLPKMHGADVAQALREDGSGFALTALMSGVFKDKAFIKEVSLKTGAHKFFTKPFDLDELITVLDQHLSELIEEQRDPIFQLLTQPQSTSREVLKAIEKSELVSGNDLPYLYSLLLDAGLSGHLNIISESGAISGIAFTKGKIINVDVPDKTTFLGALLVEHGFITPASLEATLAGGNERRLGDRLLDANLLSPHGLHIALGEQMVLRLSRTIESLPAKINFVPSEVDEGEPYIDLEAYTPFLHEWLFSKIKPEWLQSFYNQWLDHKLQKGPRYKEAESLLKYPVFEKLPNFLAKLMSDKTLGALLSSQTYPEATLLRGLHLLIVRRVLCFDTARQNLDVNEKVIRINKWAAGLEKKNHFEVFEMLGINRKAKSSEIQKVYRDFSKTYHPDRVMQSLPKDLLPVANHVFATITAAYKVLSDDKARDAYASQLAQVETRKQLEAQAMFEEARSFLKRNQPKQALEMLNQCCSVTEATSEMKLHRLWAQLKASEGVASRIATLSEIENEIITIPPEDRHNGVYFFVKGLLEKALGKLESAQRNFEHAAATDPKLIEAKRELSVLRATPAEKKPQNVLNADLKDVLGILFKKKSG